MQIAQSVHRSLTLKTGPLVAHDWLVVIPPLALFAPVELEFEIGNEENFSRI